MAAHPVARDSFLFLDGGGEAGALIRSIDWSKTPLGPIDSWSPSLRMMVSLLLANRFPLLLWWGPGYIQIYNDAYRPVPGAKHPRSMGQPARECWPEIWHVIGPLIDTPFQGGPATWSEDLALEINRHGFMEETHFTVAYSPVPDPDAPGGIGGVLATVHETTLQVIQDRRMRALRDLGARTVEARSAEAACAFAAEVFGKNPADVPFAAVYLADEQRRSASFACAAGMDAGTAAAPRVVSLEGGGGALWPLDEVFTTEQPRVVDDLSWRLTEVPPGPWRDPPHQALLLPIPSGIPHRPAGVFVAGVSARLALDDAYRSFFELATAQVGTAIASARAYEEERKRAEALAEIDRAKTSFFSNVSHEFRTPLTLILGPLEDAIVEAEDSRQRERLQLLHRNALRLQKLVNTLLDFSRIEAGRIQASYAPTDLAALTRDLASVFRAAIERVGMRLIVDCPPLSEPVHVDREMYEKIVLNLVSNAFKFTLAGEIEVRLCDADPVVELSIRDTGSGIAAEQLPHVFERFHRVEGVRARTHEGTGIGLALVKELVEMHGGTVRVESVLGRGSTFTITIRKGTTHLPADRIGTRPELSSTALGADHYLEEALRWLPDGNGEAEAESDGPRDGHPRPRIVWADDNADLRDYVNRILRPHYDVESVPDGEAALAALRRQPADLVITDVMMPRLDGFGLLRALRADERTRTVPVLMLSARAGEEARVEGLRAGADDYLIKPFSARELLARIRAHLEMARLRREAAEALRQADRRKDEFLATLAHELRNPLAPIYNSLKILRLSRGGGSDERVVDMLERQVNHMVRLVDDLIEISRITRGRIELRKAVVELEDIVRSAVEISEPLIEEARHELVLDLPEEPVTLEVDPVRIAQVLANLLNNAAKYTEPGGVIQLAARRDDSQVTIFVRDSGIGMPADFLPRVFDLFVQADQGCAHSGLGVGLSLVRTLVEMHGGSVEARSEGLGHGSEFVVRLPLSRRARAPEDGDDRAREASTIPAQRVLVVDDQRDSAESLQLLLQHLGAKAETAHDGRSALEAIRSFRPSVVLLDLGLPDMDGHEVARRAREEPEGPDLTLIALTGWGQEEDRRRSRESGIDHHLIKPVDIAVLQKLLAGLGPAGTATARERRSSVP